MIGCFLGVFMLATGNPNEEEKTSTQSYINRIVGLSCVFTCAWCYSFVVVLNRQMKDIHFSIILSVNGFVVGSCLLIYLIIENGFNLNLRIFHYSYDQYLQLLGISLVNTLGMNLNTIAS